MTTAPDSARQSASPVYRAMRDFVQTADDSLPGKFEITKEGIVLDMMSPGGPHEVTAAHVSRRLEKVMPDDLLAHNGTPDVEDEPEGIMRHPDVVVIAWTDLNVEGSIDPHTVIAAIEVVSKSNPDNDWVTKLRDYPLMGIPVYAVFDPRTGTGAVFTDIHATPAGPRYATRKDFVYGEDVTIAGWTIPTDGLPRYPSKDGEQE
ncbi:Uma2 family endonuclease [Streptomyces griseosporeus]|uniref:Uma2 family endonuclease n=1 Tax=Streptomyces griseosporeus TaxID=1910 RepID=UPI0036FDA948